MSERASKNYDGIKLESLQDYIDIYNGIKKEKMTEKETLIFIDAFVLGIQSTKQNLR